MEVVIDTSAVLAVVGNEPEKNDLIRLTQGAALIAPPSVHWEIGNALSAMFRRRAATLEKAMQALESYQSIPIRFIDVPLKQAVQLSSQLNIYAYDAYVLACAINQKAPIMTLDNELIEKAGALDIDVLNGNNK